MWRLLGTGENRGKNENRGRNEINVNRAANGNESGQRYEWTMDANEFFL